MDNRNTLRTGGPPTDCSCPCCNYTLHRRCSHAGLRHWRCRWSQEGFEPNAADQLNAADPTWQCVAAHASQADVRGDASRRRLLEICWVKWVVRTVEHVLFFVIALWWTCFCVFKMYLRCNCIVRFVHTLSVIM